MKNRYWVVWNSSISKWQVKKTLKSTALKNFDTKEPAKEYAISIAKNNMPSLVSLKKKDGTMENEWSYEVES